MDQCQGDWKFYDQQTREKLSIPGSILLKTVFLHLAYKTMVLLHNLTQSIVSNMSSEFFYGKLKKPLKKNLCQPNQLDKEPKLSIMNSQWGIAKMTITR